MVVVVVNYVMIIVPFTHVLSLDHRRQRSNRIDCFCCCTSPNSSNSSNSSSGGSSSSGDGSSLCEEFSKAYARCLLHPLVKVCVLLLFAALLGLSAWGSLGVEVGLPLTDIVPSDHYVGEFLREREANYHTWQAGLAVGLDAEGREQPLDFARDLRRLLDLERQLEQAPGMSRSLPLTQTSWVDQFVRYLNQERPDTLNTSDPYPGLGLLPYSDSFYSALRPWIDREGIGNVDRLVWDANRTRVIASNILVVQQQLRSAEQVVEHIRQTRRLTDTSGLPVFVGGLSIDLYEQYVLVNQRLLTGLSSAAIGVLLASFTLLLHPSAVLLMGGVIAMTTFEVYGCLSFLSLKVNGVCVVNLVMCLGVSVEFTAHIVRAYMVSGRHSRQERASEAIQVMFTPTANSLVSTFLGILPMGFASFPYFRLYFFQQYLAIIVLGGANGIVLLPVLLSLVGPSFRLQPPTTTTTTTTTTSKAATDSTAAGATSARPPAPPQG